MDLQTLSIQDLLLYQALCATELAKVDEQLQAALRPKETNERVSLTARKAMCTVALGLIDEEITRRIQAIRDSSTPAP